jgi:hypothetical protein
MKERLVHEWRDWFLKYVGDTYELIRKENHSVQPITAKNDIDAEIQGQLLIKNAEENDKSLLFDI